MLNRQTRLTRALPWLLAAYGLASFAHFAHNAEYLGSYPNLPTWLSRLEVYGAWCAMTGVGAIGYWLLRRSHAQIGLALLTVYAALGFDGLLHYQRAPMAAHTIAMNVTIWIEVMTAAVALIAVSLRGLVLQTAFSHLVSFVFSDTKNTKGNY